MRNGALICVAACLLAPYWAEASPAHSPEPSLSFLAAKRNGGGISELFEPNPNTWGAVGPNHIVTVLSSTFQVQDRTGGVVQAESPENFWTNGTGWVFNDPFGDPYDHKVLYDPYESRWIVTAGANAFKTNALILVAVSQTSDPTGAWNRYRFDADTNHLVWADFPITGFNKKWVAVFATMKGLDADNIVRGNLYVFDKAALYADGAVTPTVFELSWRDFSMVPLTTYDDDLDTLYLVHLVAATRDPRIATLTGAVGGEELTLATATAETREDWDITAPGNNFAPQTGTTEKIWFHGLLHNGVYRNDSIWFSQTIFLPKGDISRSAVQWWQLTTNATILQRGRIDDPSGATFYGTASLAVNQNDEMLIGYSSFSTSQYASAEYAFRTAADPPNTTRPPRLLKAGETPYEREDLLHRIRWGVTSATTVDPVDDTGLWTLQEYAASPADDWGTWWGEITPPTADLRVTATATPSALEAGSNFIYTVVLTNAGPAIASGVVISNLLAPGTVCASVSSTRDGCRVSDGRVVCDVGDFTNGTAVTITMGIYATQPGSLVNTSRVSMLERDPEPADNTTAATVTVSQASDLTIVIADNPDPVVSGAPLQYVITVIGGTTGVSNVFVTNTLPDIITFVSVASSQGTCTETGGVVVCDLGNLAAGNTATITNQVVPNSEGVLTNVAVVRADEPDPRPANNRFEAHTVALAGSDLAVFKTASRPFAVENDTVVFTILVTNRGPQNVSDVQIYDPLPLAFAVVSAGADQGVYSEGSGVWTVGDLLVGDAARLVVTSLVEYGSAGLSYTNTATVSVVSLPDPFATNDSANAAVEVFGADISVSILDSPDPLPVDSKLTYTVIVSNSGHASPTNAWLTFTLHNSLDFLSVTSTLGTCSSSNGLLSCNFGPFPSGAVAVVTIEARPTTNVLFGSLATVGSSTYDPNILNNGATVLSEALYIDRIWINEVDYDTPAPILSEDDEWIELVGEAGASLDEYKLIIYGTWGNVRRTVDLEDAGWTFSDETNGFGFCVVGRLDPGDGVADFTPTTWTAVLSNWEGSSLQLAHKASLGASYNLHFIDYGADVPQTDEDQLADVVDSSTAQSTIFLTGGTGASYRAFFWTNTVGAATPGAINPGQLVGDDTDHDGLPDWWEFLYFSGLTNSAGGNYDGDPATNGAEYVADTIPTNGLSLFLINAVAPTNGDQRNVWFVTSTARVYDVWVSTNLLTNIWDVLYSNMPGIGGPTAVMDTNPAPRFYRATVRLP